MGPSGRKRMVGSVYDGRHRAGAATATLNSTIGLMKCFPADQVVNTYSLWPLVQTIEYALQKERRERRYYNRNQHADEPTLRAAPDKVRAIYLDTLRALDGALDVCAPDTETHSRRVTLYSLLIASRMGYSNHELNHLAHCAYLHDVGKAVVPDSILRKRGQLTVTEIAVVRTHAQVGYDLVRRIQTLAPAAEVVRSHHERHAGNGYPRGLKGTDIPLDARILAVADTLDALTSNRPYRQAIPFSAALDEIENGSGIHFDPQVIRAFFFMPENLWQDICRPFIQMRHAA